MAPEIPDPFHTDWPQPEPLTAWTLRVHNLGRLQTAELQIRPLMLLVGENNTGKTYLATILYSIFQEIDRLFPDAPPTSPAYEACKAWITTLFTPPVQARDLKPEDCAPFLLWLNEVIAERSVELLALAFNHEVTQNTRVEITNLELLRTPQLRVTGSGTSEEDYRYYVEMDGAYRELLSDRDPDDNTLYQLVRFVAKRLIRLDQSSTVYLPASRTGLVQLFQEIQLRSNDRRRLRPRQTEPTARLTPPVLDLIDDLTRHDPGNASRFADEARDLERSCLHGEVVQEPLPGRGYRYRPTEAVSLPMALSSAVVTELVPIILTLRHKLHLGLLILDEPEAHLHPKLQRVLAQIIVRLVRKGLRVCLTTHSENFCQQINNFIKIGSFPEPAKTAQDFGYPSNAYLKSNEVVAYEFKGRGQYAEMHRLPQSDTGISMPLFNDELLKLSEETLKLQDMLPREADAP